MKIEMIPIGNVSRLSPNEDVKDRNLVSKIVINREFEPALAGIDGWSHIYIIFWLHKTAKRKPAFLTHAGSTLGVLAARSAIHPNSIGLTLVELVKREGGVLWVKGLDAQDGTPVLDIKPYPDWEHGRFIVITDYRAPGQITRSMESG
jgi:tRNA-Thr(GGU) m(6)t(6)A37 methyltransferase TsaA